MKFVLALVVTCVLLDQRILACDPDLNVVQQVDHDYYCIKDCGGN